MNRAPTSGTCLMCPHQEEEDVVVGQGSGEEEAVNAVQNTAVAGEDGPEVFDAQVALQGGFA